MQATARRHLVYQPCPPLAVSEPNVRPKKQSPSPMSTRSMSPEMTPVGEPISATRLVVALSLVSFAAFAWWSSEGAATGILGLPVVIANVVMMSRSDRSRPVSRNQLIAILLILAALVLCIVLFPGERTTASRQHHIEQMRWYSQAYFVLPVWALICYSLYSRYRRSRQSSDLPSAAITSP
jgi:hypothetical protein